MSTITKFSTIGNAKKQTGLSYLGSVASSSKIAKGLQYNEMTYILYFFANTTTTSETKSFFNINTV